MKLRSSFARLAAPYIVGCLTGFLLSAFLFQLINPNLALSQSSAMSPFTPSSLHSSLLPLSSRRQFIPTSHDGFHSSDSDPDAELELNGALIHSNHSTLKLLACLEQRGPANAAIVPTRSHPSFAITVLHPDSGHTTSQALLRHGVDDVHILHVLAPLLHGECGKADGKTGPGLIVIAQADVGFMGIYAASVGCPVLVLESRDVMQKALRSTLCANPQYADRIWLESFMLHEASSGSAAAEQKAGDVKLVRTYADVDTKEGEYAEENAEAHFDCNNPTVAAKCKDLPSISLTALLSPSATVFSHFARYPKQAERPIFLLQLSGDPPSVRALLSSESLITSNRVYHVLLSFRPHLLGLSLSKELLSAMERWGYEIAEIPYIPVEDSYSLFHSLKAYVATAFTSLASYTRPLRYTELDGFPERIFECEDKRRACRVDLLFTLMNGRFIAGIVPFQQPA